MCESQHSVDRAPYDSVIATYVVDQSPRSQRPSGHLRAPTSVTKLRRDARVLCQHAAARPKSRDSRAALRPLFRTSPVPSLRHQPSTGTTSTSTGLRTVRSIVLEGPSYAKARRETRAPSTRTTGDHHSYHQLDMTIHWHNVNEHRSENGTINHPRRTKLTLRRDERRERHRQGHGRSPFLLS
jgi:hypothetical protein